jgi:hypothetical protein
MRLLRSRSGSRRTRSDKTDTSGRSVMAQKRIVDRHNRLRPDAKPRMMPSKLCRRWRHIGGASVTRRLRRDGREAEEGLAKPSPTCNSRWPWGGSDEAHGASGLANLAAGWGCRRLASAHRLQGGRSVPVRLQGRFLKSPKLRIVIGFGTRWVARHDSVPFRG